MSYDPLKPTRHRAPNGEFWYRVGLWHCVTPFTRSRMNRKTLGCYGKSARTKPIVSKRMWAVGTLSADDVPFSFSSASCHFGAPMDYHDAFDLKAEAIAEAKKRAATMPQ